MKDDLREAIANVLSGKQSLNESDTPSGLDILYVNILDYIKYILRQNGDAGASTTIYLEATTGNKFKHFHNAVTGSKAYTLKNKEEIDDAVAEYRLGVKAIEALIEDFQGYISDSKTDVLEQLESSTVNESAGSDEFIKGQFDKIKSAITSLSSLLEADGKFAKAVIAEFGEGYKENFSELDKKVYDLYDDINDLSREILTPTDV